MFISELSGMVSIGTLLATGLDGDDFTTGVGIICFLFTIIIWVGLCCLYCEGDDFELDSDEGSGHCGVIKEFSGWGNGENAWLVRTSKFICTSLPFCIIGGMYSYQSAGASVLASAIIGVFFCAFAVAGSCSKGTDGEKWACINCETNGDNSNGSNGSSFKNSANPSYYNDGTGAFSIDICDEGLAEFKDYYNIPNDSEWTNFVEANLYFSCAPGQMLDTIYNDPNFKPYSISEHGDYSKLNEICCKEIYITEPPTSGKVLLETTHGDVEIELWCKEAPIACRNFVQLCMEGYYDNTIFHRIVKDFLIQGGDPTGTGMGGDSIYGKPFKNEYHQRLKFQRRGLVAMVNDEEGNGSQFFITLERADDLNKKNTIFGTLKGNTLFNVLQMAELPCIANDRPEDPPRIKRVEVLNAYFTDILPRVTAASRRAAAEAAAAAHAAKTKKKRSVKAVKNFKLMSFGDEAEEEEISTIEAKAKVGKIVSSHDAGVDSRLSRKAASTLTAEEAAAAAEAAVAKDRVTAVPDGASAPKYQFTSAEDRIAAANEEARKLIQEIKGPSKSAQEAAAAAAAAEAAAAKQRTNAQMLLDEQASVYEAANAALKGTSKKKRQDDTLAMLGMFTSQLNSDVQLGGDFGGGEPGNQAAEATLEKKASEEEAGEDEDQDQDEEQEEDADEYDANWMTGALKDPEFDRFATEGIDPDHDPNTLTLEDPRNPMNQRRREKDGGSKGSGSGGSRSRDRWGGGGNSRDRDRGSSRSRRDYDRR
eukprot:gene5200-26194_t